MRDASFAPAQKESEQAKFPHGLQEFCTQILAQRGHDGFSTSAVAERARVNIASFYPYCPRKEALIGALIVRETSHLIDDAAAAKAQFTGTAGLVALILAAVGRQFRRPCTLIFRANLIVGRRRKTSWRSSRGWWTRRACAERKTKPSLRTECNGPSSAT